MDRDIFHDGDLTEEEQKLFDEMSKDLRGQDPSDAEPPPASTERAQAQPEPATKEADQEKVQDKDQDKEEEDAAITIDKDGRARNASGKFVPHKALHAERAEHNKTRAELATMREERARVDERLKLLMKAYEGETPAEAPKEKAPTWINPNDDFIGALKQMQEHAERTNQHFSQRAEQEQQAAAEKELAERWQRDLWDFGNKTPDFQESVKYLLGKRHSQLSRQGVKDEAMRNQILAKEEMDLYRRSYQDGLNPAEIVYGLAQDYGYQPPQQQAPEGKQNGQAPAQSAAAQKIAQVASNMQKAGGSLSNAHGAGGDSISAQQLAAMSEDEFFEYTQKISDRTFEKRFLGRER